jgi:hypothetical protein
MAPSWYHHGAINKWCQTPSRREVMAITAALFPPTIFEKIRRISETSLGEWLTERLDRCHRHLPGQASSASFCSVESGTRSLGQCPTTTRHRGGMMIARSAEQFRWPCRQCPHHDAPGNHRTPLSDNVRQVECWFSQIGNPGGRKPGSRNRLNEEVISSFLRDWRVHGDHALAKVRRTQPAVDCKLAVLLVPREQKVEYTNAISGLSDEQLEAMIADIQDRLDRRAAGDQAKVIEAAHVRPPQVGFRRGVRTRKETRLA